MVLQWVNGDMDHLIEQYVFSGVQTVELQYHKCTGIFFTSNFPQG